jgi:hypothetical protein
MYITTAAIQITVSLSSDMTSFLTNPELNALKYLPITVLKFTVEHRSVFQKLVENTTNKKHSTDLEMAETMLTMLDDVTVRLIDMTEFRLFALNWTEERLQNVEHPDANMVQTATQTRTDFENRLLAVHRKQLPAIAHLNIGPSLEVQRDNLTRSTDINEQFKAVLGLVGLLREVVLNLARYRNGLITAYSTVDEYMARSTARLMSVKYPVAYECDVFGRR